MEKKKIYIYILLIVVLSIMLLNAQNLANLILTQKTILKPTPTTPDAAVYRLEQGDIVNVTINPLTPSEDLVLFIRAYSVKPNFGSEFNPVLIRHLLIKGPVILNQTVNYTIEVKRAGNYAIEVYNNGDTTYEVEVEFKPIKLEVWTTRIRFIVATPLALIGLMFIAKLFERED